MDALWNFLIDVMQRALMFWRVIQPSQAGVRTFCGKKPVALYAGLHLVCPVIGEIVIIDITEQVLDVRPQQLTTADGVSVACGLSIAYEVSNPVKAVYGNYDHDQNLADESLRVVGEYVTKHTFDELRDCELMARAIIVDLRKIATDRWGLKLLRIGRTDFCKARAIRLIGNREQTKTQQA